MYDSIKKINAVTKAERGYTSKVSIEVQENKLKIHGESQDGVVTSTYADTVASVIDESDDASKNNELYFDIKFVLDSLRQIKTDHVCITYGDENAGVLFVPVDDIDASERVFLEKESCFKEIADASYKSVLMRVRRN